MTNASQFHKDNIIIDGLNASNFFDPRIPQRLHSGGITAVNATIAAWHTPHETINLLADALLMLEQNSDKLMQARSAADIHKAKESNRVGFIFGFQGADPLGDNLNMLRLYHALGVRIIQLTYNFCNQVGCGCYEKEDTGLTAFGKRVVLEMNRLGILVDVSHCGVRTTLDAVETSQMPIAITHANASALVPAARNKSDEVLKAVVAKGGMVGAVIFPPMLTGSGVAKIDDYVKMIDYLVNLVGIDHVGLGPDFMEEMDPKMAAQALKGLSTVTLQQFSTMPPTQGFASVAECANVTEALLKHGYKEEDTAKIMGGNWLKLYQQVWK